MAASQEIDEAQDLLSGRMLDNLKIALGDAWANKLSAAERQMVIATLDDLSAMTLLGVITGKGLDAERQQLLAQLSSITAIEAERFQHYVMVAAGRAAFTGVQWLVAAAAPYLL